MNHDGDVRPGAIVVVGRRLFTIGRLDDAINDLFHQGVDFGKLHIFEESLPLWMFVTELKRINDERVARIIQSRDPFFEHSSINSVDFRGVILIHDGQSRKG